MLFKDVLNKYLDELNCTPKELSTRSGISQSVISRYRSGERTPQKNSDQLLKIVDTIYDMSDKSNEYERDKILKSFIDVIDKDKDFNYEDFSKKINELISALSINTSDMSKYIVFDASHISRIRYGKTKPSDPIDFSTKICNYIVYKYNNNESKSLITSILKCNLEDIAEDTKFYNALFNYLTDSCETINNQVKDFLINIDSFNLNDYIKAIKFDELKVPNVPFYITKNKNYYGIEEMKQGELDFFKGTVLSKSTEDIFMCSDMPMEDMAKDVDFGKKWMFAIAMSLKKGLHLNIIHNLDRPFNEMMLGLESWIPIYMTGQVSPYYLKEVKNSVYNHLNYVSGALALSGECIKGAHDKGKYYLTHSNKELQYYRQKANLLLKKANSLMDIYRQENRDSYNLFLTNDVKLDCDRKRYLSSLPLFTIDEKLLVDILKENYVSEDDIKSIIKYKQIEEKNVKSILQNYKIFDNIFKIEKDDFEESDVCLSLENMFFDKKIKYTYNQYINHFNSTVNYSKKMNNYKLTINDYRTFKNITISILENNYVVLSKNSSPVIHFVIRHPKLVDAIKNFNPIVKEN